MNACPDARGEVDPRRRGARLAGEPERAGGDDLRRPCGDRRRPAPGSRSCRPSPAAPGPGGRSGSRCRPSPTAVEPVNDSAATRASRASASPTTRPLPCTTLSTPAGRPASCRAAARFARGQRGELGRLDDDGVAADQRGRRSSRPGWRSGSSTGVISPTTPERLRRVSEVVPGSRAGQHLAVGAPALAAEVAQHVDGPLHLALGLGERLALLAAPGRGRRLSWPRAAGCRRRPSGWRRGTGRQGGPAGLGGGGRA